MADENSTNGNRGGDAPREDSIARLISLAGPRPAIPEDVQARVHDAVRAEWRQATARPRAPRWVLPFAMAASLVLAAILVGRFVGSDAEPVATIVLAQGVAQESGATLAPGDPVFAGDTLTTGVRGAALAFPNGMSLRLAGHTTATLEAVDEISIVAGRLYADTGFLQREERLLTVHTPLGSASDRGTQFAVRYEDGAMSVAVRKGSVDVAARRASWTAEAGQRLTLQPGRAAEFDEIAAHDPFWDWAASLAPVFDIDRRSVFDFLSWAARETGRELVFASDSVRLAAMGSTLSGSISGLTPSEAIDAVLPTTRFEVRVDGREMIVAMTE